MDARKSLVVEAFAQVARPTILKFFPPNSCVASTRIAMECFSRFGLRSEATASKLMVLDVALERAYVSGFREEREDMEARALSFETLSEVGSYDRHVVCLVERRWLVDASFDQASRAGVRITPHVFTLEFPRDFVASGSLHLSVVAEHEGVTLEVQYVTLPDRSFEATPAWETDHLQLPIALICADMSAALEEA